MGEEFTERDKFAIAAIFDMVVLLHKHASRSIKKDEQYEEVIERIDRRAYRIMKELKYWSESEEDSENEAEETCQKTVATC